MEAIARGSMGKPAVPFDPGAFIPEDRHLDEIVRQLFVSNDKYQEKLDGLLGDRSRIALRQLHRRARGTNPTNASWYNKEIARHCDDWKTWRSCYRKALEPYWSPDWSYEHAEKMAERYDRNAALLRMYEKGLPEGRHLLDDFRERANRLGLGEGLPVVATIAGLAAGLAAGWLLSLAAPVIAAAAPVAAPLVGTGTITVAKTLADIVTSGKVSSVFKNMEVDKRTKEMMTDNNSLKEKK